MRWVSDRRLGNIYSKGNRGIHQEYFI